MTFGGEVHRVFTHNVLFARLSPDDVEERGPITRSDAVQLFRVFPFETELKKRSHAPALTAPTITFRDEQNDLDLAIWSEASERFVIWFPAALGLARNVMDLASVEDCIGLFFDGRIDELVQRIAGLDGTAKAEALPM